MNIALWVAQILLAVLYGMTGTMKTLQIARVREMNLVLLALSVLVVLGRRVLFTA